MKTVQLKVTSSVWADTGLLNFETEESEKVESMQILLKTLMMYRFSFIFYRILIIQSMTLGTPG